MATIKRAKRNTPFVQIDKTPLQDSGISWKAKGLLAYLLSLPDDWKIYQTELPNHATDGRDSTASAIKELIKAGYMTRQRAAKEDGKFQGYDYTVSEKPQRVNRNGETVNGETVNGKPATTNNNSTDNDYTNNDREIEENAPAKKTAQEIFELAEKAFPLNEINQEDFDGENSAKFVALKNEAPTPLEVGRLMAEYYNTDLGRGQLKTMCFAAGNVPIDEALKFIEPLCVKWALKQQPYTLINWRKETAGLSSWIENKYRDVKRSSKPSAAKESNNSVSKLKEAGVYDNTPVISYQ